MKDERNNTEKLKYFKENLISDFRNANDDNFKRLENVCVLVKGLVDDICAERGISKNVEGNPNYMKLHNFTQTINDCKMYWNYTAKRERESKFYEVVKNLQQDIEEFIVYYGI